MARMIGTEPMVREQLFIPVDMAAALQAYSNATGLSKCEVVRRALTEFLEKEAGYQALKKAA